MKLTTSQKQGLMVLLFIGLIFAGIRLRTLWMSPSVITPKQDNEHLSAQTSLTDINAATAIEFEKLPGIGPVLAERIVKYRRYVKGFESIDELKEVYGIEDSLVENLRPRLSLGTFHADPADNSRYGSAKKYEKEKWSDDEQDQKKEGEFFAESPEENSKTYTPFQPVDLNTADSVALERAPGIGPVSAGRIVAYRKRLGFFHSVEQLKEVKGIFGENFDRMKSLVTLSENLTALPHLSINTDDGTRLRNHPYVGYKNANLILAYRKEHGPFKNLDDCRKMLAITPETWDKLAPYLEF